MKRLKQYLLTMAGVTVLSSGSLMAQYLVGGTDFVFISSDAILSTDVAYQPWNSLANFGDGSNANTSGAVILADGNDSWNFDFTVPAPEITAIELWTRVGALTDNGMQDFSVSFFDGNDLLMGTETGSAALTASWQTFATSQSYVGAASFVVNFTSNFGQSTAAEVNELRFATPTAVPEPSGALMVGLAGVVLLLRRSRRALAA
ncbi:PEP-CTERM sorting domain-containing protein [Phragmitibacter flavus]|uniref:PEP-CTERM sorting domain-containing protein n=1 Tax=Phragmitibacter flavus TaxID=2576071 RepID=A0A5R8KKC0_9BACT|nr:PEP-CTERM sorting domain-containing protein [Phragmitibacter flavus]TLD72681.1 PEP-CTERM sorting domain-containing protein [Phragmitibacter flavus]